MLYLIESMKYHAVCKPNKDSFDGKPEHFSEEVFIRTYGEFLKTKGYTIEIVQMQQGSCLHDYCLIELESADDVFRLSKDIECPVICRFSHHEKGKPVVERELTICDRTFYSTSPYYFENAEKYGELNIAVKGLRDEIQQANAVSYSKEQVLELIDRYTKGVGR